MASSNAVGMKFRSGEQAPESGVYRVTHRRHRLPHNVTILDGEAFPACRVCGETVSFELIQIARRFTLDSDFANSATA